MDPACLRHTEIPGTSKLFADLSYHFDRVARLLPPQSPPSGIVRRRRARDRLSRRSPCSRGPSSGSPESRQPSGEAVRPGRNGRGRHGTAGGIVFGTRLHHLQSTHGGAAGRGSERARNPRRADLLAGDRRSRFSRSRSRLDFRCGTSAGDVAHRGSGRLAGPATSRRNVSRGTAARSPVCAMPWPGSRMARKSSRQLQKLIRRA